MALDKPSGLKLPTCIDDVLAYPAEDFLYHHWGTVVVRTQPGVVLKCWQHLTDEADAMRFARDKVNLPVPKVLYVPPPPKNADGTAMVGGVWYICMEECQGQSLDKAIDTMTEDDLDHIAIQLSNILRRMSNVHSSRLGTVHGGPYQNMFFPEHLYPEKSFESVDEFIDAYRQLLLLVCTETFTETLLSHLPRDAFITFTHGDLLPKNIMVKGTTITGIVDWGTGGFYPSYWEYCRMYDPHFMTPAWDRLLSRVFPGKRRHNEVNAVRKILNIISHSF